MDGSSYKEGTKVGLILKRPEEQKFEYALQFRFKASNNKAEYKSLNLKAKIGFKGKNR